MWVSARLSVASDTEGHTSFHTGKRIVPRANHYASKSIVTRYPHSLIGLEDLTDIRERTRHRKGKRASKKQRKANATRSKWAFAELHSLIAYKALRAGSMTTAVDAHYTSKSCLVCGYTAEGNRPNKGLSFVCQVCHFRLHADLVGARNITMRTLLVRQDWASTGSLSVCPDASDREAKAARLARYGSRCGGVQMQAPALAVGFN